MAGLGVDTDEFGRVAGVGCLKCGGILEGMRGDYAVVMVGGGDEYCRIGCAVVLDVVDGRVLKKILGHFRRVGARAVVRCPVPADGEEMVAHHVHHAYAGDSDFEEVGDAG